MEGSRNIRTPPVANTPTRDTNARTNPKYIVLTDRFCAFTTFAISASELSVSDSDHT